MTENKGTAPKEMAPVNSHRKKSSTDRKIIQDSNQQKFETEGEKGKIVISLLLGMTWQAMNRERLTESSFVHRLIPQLQGQLLWGSWRWLLRRQVLLISSVGKANFKKSGLFQITLSSA